MSVLGGTKKEREAIVYVLADHVNSRPFIAQPRRNAAELDLEEAFGIDRIAPYPDIQDRFLMRQSERAKRIRSNRAWSLDALDAIYAGTPIPGNKRDRWEDVLRSLVLAGPVGRNRKEICMQYTVDGGRVSAAMTFLHEAGIIFPLEGVKR